VNRNLHIRCRGHGPAVVLIHGWALHGEIFNPLVERLEKRCQVYVVDLPGHGLSRNTSTALQLSDLTKTFAATLPPAVWCGWSLGGLLALHAADALPQVRGLIMLAATPCFVRHEYWPDAMDPAVFNQFRRGLIGHTSRTLERFLALNVKGSHSTHTSLRYLHHVASQYAFPALHHLEQGLDMLQHTDLRALLPQLNKPTLWIGGANDHLIPAPALNQAAAFVKHTKTSVHSLAGCSHIPFIDQPDTVARLICDFIHASTV